MRKPGVPRARRADVPELASTGMKRDQLLESGLTSPLLSHVQRRFPTLHEFPGKPWQGGCPQPLTAHDNGGPHGLTARVAHTAPKALWWVLQTRGPLPTQSMKRALREPCRRRRRGISVPESPHCRTEWHPRSSATISPQIAPRVSLTRYWQRLPLPRPRKKR